MNPNEVGPGGIKPGSYDPTKLTQEQRNWLFRYFGNTGEASVGYGGQYVSGSPEDISAKRGVFETKQRGEEEQFINKFKTEYPTILTGIEGELGLPALRETAFTSTQAYKDLPEAIRVASQGRDVSANQLARMTSAQQAERLPEINDLLASLQFGEEEFGRRAQRELVPLQEEAKIMTDRWAREASGFDSDADNNLNYLIRKMNTGAQLTMAEMAKATKLAELESQKIQLQNTVSTVDLGNRVALIDYTGKEVGSLPIGLAPTRGAGGTSSLGTLADQSGL